jgi:Zn-dependent protease
MAAALSQAEKDAYTIHIMSEDLLLSLFYFLILIFSIMVHEVAHGIAAEHEGDPTARLLGRITLNPIKHIDWFGSIILPLILVISHAGFVVGWAKPVPYNPNNVRHGNKSVARIAIAGILVNLVIAIAFGILIRVLVYFNYGALPLLSISSLIVLVNLVLAFFNSIPLSPLDGFTFFKAIFGGRMTPFLSFMERYSLPILVVFLIFGWNVVSPVIYLLYGLLTGIPIG